jgi:alpha-glucosidase
VPSRAERSGEAWWRDAVVYQIYPRSFQDSDGDGVGDLAGIRARLDHLERLGVDAIWLSPMYPSPMRDFGYDVAAFDDVDPVFGTLGDFDALLADAHGRGIRVLLDLVPCHTSIEHPWFREHPEYYVWHDGPEPPNNWVAAFGGRAWSWDEERGLWYLHSFYPEQPDLDWRTPEVRARMQEVVAFWIGRGVDGFRLDAIDRLGKDPDLRDDPEATEPPFFPVEKGEYATLEHRYSKNTDGVRTGLAALREAAGDALLVGEIYLPTSDWPRYLESLDSVFAFELFHAELPWRADALRGVLERALEFPSPSWVFSNHDAPRLRTRLGDENLRVAAMLLLTLPGLAFLYYGDEIGLGDGPGADPPLDRAGRDGARHPMQWDAGVTGGFSEGEPWLPAVDPVERNVAGQAEDPGSLLALHRQLIAVRRRLGTGFAVLDADPGLLAYRRGDHVVVLNPGEEARPRPAEAGTIVVGTDPEARWDGFLPAHAGGIFEVREER